VSKMSQLAAEELGTKGIYPDALHDAQYEMYSVAKELIRLADMAKEELTSNPPADGDFPSWAVRNARCAGTLDHIEWYLRQMAERLDKEAK
jgi:hypothetical protein